MQSYIHFIYYIPGGKNLQREPFQWFFHGKKIAHSKAIFSERLWSFAILLISSILYKYIGHSRVPLELFVGPCGGGLHYRRTRVEDFWTSSVNFLSPLNCTCIIKQIIFNKNCFDPLGRPLWGFLINKLRPM